MDEFEKRAHEVVSQLFECGADRQGIADRVYCIAEALRQARDEGDAAGWRRGIEACALHLDSWIQGTLDMVNSGDSTLEEIYPELRKLQKMQQSIRKLAADSGKESKG